MARFIRNNKDRFWKIEKILVLAVIAAIAIASLAEHAISQKELHILIIKNAVLIGGGFWGGFFLTIVAGYLIDTIQSKKRGIYIAIRIPDSMNFLKDIEKGIVLTFEDHNRAVRLKLVGVHEDKIVYKVVDKKDNEFVSSVFNKNIQGNMNCGRNGEYYEYIAKKETLN